MSKSARWGLYYFVFLFLIFLLDPAVACLLAGGNCLVAMLLPRIGGGG